MKKLSIILSIILSSCGGGGGGGTDSNEIQNNPPTINNSNFTYDVVENQTQAFSVNASDPDNDVIVYEINGGADENLFLVDSSGQVFFLTAPDFENPADQNQNNSYEVSVRVYDGELYSSSSTFTVNVTNDENDDADNSSPSCIDQSQNTLFCELVWEDINREFYIVNPNNLTSDSQVPLLISLHGGADYADANMQYTGFLDIIDEKGFVAIFPQGTIAEGKGDTGWYAGGDCSGLEVCDLSFIERLIDYSIESLNIDKNRVYVSGFSNGAFMVYTLACFLSDKIAAFAPVSGSMSPDDYQICNPQRPIPVIHIHGINDDSIPVQGSDYVTPLQDVSSYLSSINNCAQNSVVDGEDTNEDGYAWYSEISSDCNDNVTVNFTYLENFGHNWPSTESSKGGGADIDAASFIWEFLFNYDINGSTN
tara:strand:+ start:2383 stop:3651 length:1269 start_codon:yes stop_codon:yes gene_type:complete